MSNSPEGASAQVNAPGVSERQDGSADCKHLCSPADLRVLFQPIVSLGDGTAFGQEALVRCERPGLQEPAALFARAVMARCSGRLGRMIREMAVRAAAGLPLFVNVHPQELDDRWILRSDDPIFAHDRDVYIELTEAAPVDLTQAAELLQQLREKKGVYLAIDDLGSGYSNLTRLADLEPRIIKIDQALVRGVAWNRRRQAVLRSMVSLGHQLEADVVAEGIENQDDLSAVIDTGCDYGQGFLLGRPGLPVSMRNQAPRAVNRALQSLQVSADEPRATTVDPAH